MKKIDTKRLLVNFACIAIGFMAILICLYFLVMYKPIGSEPQKPLDENAISPYFTHKIFPQFYNGFQKGKDFEVSVEQNWINDIIARLNWPMEFDGISVSSPRVFFVPGNIVVMGRAVSKETEFAYTLIVEPELNDHRLLNLNLLKCKLGALSVTSITKSIATDAINQKITEGNWPEDSIDRRILESIILNIPFDPVYKIGKRKICVENITVDSKILKIHFLPVQNNNR